MTARERETSGRMRLSRREEEGKMDKAAHIIYTSTVPLSFPSEHHGTPAGQRSEQKSSVTWIIKDM